MLKHLAESPQEDKIICTWLLRGALHKDHFSKITAWLAFIPYFWKPSCFLRLPLLPLLLLPSLPIASPLCHVLVFICWFCSSSFSPCVKNERLKIGWVGMKGGGGGVFQDAKATTAHRWNRCLQCWGCSLLCTDSYNTVSKSPSIYIILWKPNAIHTQCKNGPFAQRRETARQCDIPTAWQEEQHWSATGSCIKTPFKSHSDIQVIWKDKSSSCMFFWISYQPCTL